MEFTVYTSPSCGYCKMAKELISSKGHKYIEKTIGKDLTKEEFFAMMNHNIKSVPQIFLGDKRIGGYESLREYYEEVTNNFGKQGF
jgi:glutaredoxin